MTTKAKAPAYEPETYYKVAIRQPIKVGMATLYPSQRHKIKGKVLTRLIEEYGSEKFYDIAPASQ